MSKHTIDEIIRLGKSSLQKDRTAYAKAVRQLFSKVDTAVGGWNPAGGEADDVDLHDMVDGVIELPRIEGVGRVAVVRRKREQTLYVGRRKYYWRWFSVLWEERGARENPGPKRRTPAILRHCVAKVAPKRGVSGAYAICTASLQRAGVMRGGTLTAMGKVRDAARSKRTPENRAKDAAFERALVRGNPSPKGQPTPLNLDVLVRTFGVLDRVSNKLDPTDVPHLSRCMKAGFLAPEGRTHLVLTPAGIEARNRHLASRPYLLNSANETRPNPGKSIAGNRALRARGNPPAKASLRDRLMALRPAIAAAAQRVYDAWDQNEEGIDDDLGGGGICDAISQEIAAIVSSVKGAEVRDGGWEGDDHAYLIVEKGRESYVVDIPPGVYETGGGYSWTKRRGVVFEPSDVVIEKA